MIDLVMAGRREAIIRRHNEMAWLAYHVAALSRTKKLPRLEKLMHQTSKREQTPEEMLALVRVMNAAFGGTVKEAKK